MNLDPISQYGVDISRKGFEERRKMMKILLATIFPLPGTGGLWTYVDQLKNSLEAEEHDVDIMARHPNLQSYYIFNREEVHFNIKNHKEKLKPIKKAFEEIKPTVDQNIIREEMSRYIYEKALENFGLEKYDLIHAQDIISAQAIARNKSPFIPLILTVHGGYTTEQLIAGTIKEKGSALWHYSSLLEYVGVSLSDFTIFPSSYMKKTLLKEFYVPETNLTVIPNGINIEAFHKEMRKIAQPNLPVSNEKKVIACVARLDKIKGHNCLFKALKKLKKVRTDWVCWLIGDGKIKEQLNKKVSKLGIEEHVIFMGKRSDVPSLLKLVDICVLPSLQENCPYSIMEAQVAGKCVIASRVGGIPEMIKHGETGYLFKRGNSQLLYKQLEKVLSNEKLRNSIGNNAGEWGRVYWSVGRVLEQTLQLYKEALTKKHLLKSDGTSGDTSNKNIQLTGTENPILKSINSSSGNTPSLLTSEIPNPFFYDVIKGLTLLEKEDEARKEIYRR